MNNNCKKEKKGIVTSDKMNKTIVVKVDRKVKHSKYSKFVTKSTKYFVHDEYNTYKIGDIVYFCETAPISKNKKWVISGIK